MTTGRVVLVDDWNDDLDPDIDRIGIRSGTKNSDIKPFRDFIKKFDLVDKSSNQRRRG